MSLSLFKTHRRHKGQGKSGRKKIVKRERSSFLSGAVASDAESTSDFVAVTKREKMKIQYLHLRNICVVFFLTNFIKSQKHAEVWSEGLK